ncbi:REP-associated tyrosine transposase [Limnospira platensis CENA597]|uniref:REP-associated tyrosine transposase n=1 Tax=Limnospira platensis TaxID=118562 RepID=UPI003D9FD56F
MSNYRRLFVPGATYFFTQVTYKRNPWLCTEIGREGLRTGFQRLQKIYPFSLDAIALLPDHFHCIWTLPEGDKNYPMRWRYLKSFVTRSCSHKLKLSTEVTLSRHKRKESNLWRRYWEHLIKDEEDFENCCDYIHYNPVKHGLCESRKDWKFSSFHRLVKQGVYSVDWGVNELINFSGYFGKMSNFENCESDQ